MSDFDFQDSRAPDAQALQGSHPLNPFEFEREIKELVTATGPRSKQPGWTFSDIRTRLYPAALAQAFPDRALTHKDLIDVANALRPSPVMEDK